MTGLEMCLCAAQNSVHQTESTFLNRSKRRSTAQWYFPFKCSLLSVDWKNIGLNHYPLALFMECGVVEKTNEATKLKPNAFKNFLLIGIQERRGVTHGAMTWVRIYMVQNNLHRVPQAEGNWGFNVYTFLLKILSKRYYTFQAPPKSRFWTNFISLPLNACLLYTLSAIYIFLVFPRTLKRGRTLTLFCCLPSSSRLG